MNLSVQRERERDRETTEHSPTRAQPGSQEAPPPAGGEVGLSKSKCKAKLVAVVLLYKFGPQDFSNNVLTSFRRREAVATGTS